MNIYIFKIPKKMIDFKKYLNYDEINRVKRFNKIYGLLLKKFIIKLHNKISLDKIHFFEENGKPYFNNNFFFNISYSDNFIVGVNHNSEVGLDIEKENNNIGKILYKYGNKDYILKNSITENTKIWTKIESLLKYTNVGLKGIDNIIINTNNSINFKNKIDFYQKDISNLLPAKIYGTITTKNKILNFKVFNINSKILLKILNET